MTPEEIRRTIQDAIGKGWSFAWWHYLLWLVVTGAGAYLGTYLREKGRNTATKGDVGAITKKVEEVKSELALLSKKRSLLFDERVRVFKRLQGRLTEFKKYCIAARGSLGYGGEFHPNLETSEELERPALTHITKLKAIIEEDGVLLTDGAREAVTKLMRTLSTLSSMELTLIGNVIEDGFVNSGIEHYSYIIGMINECLLSLFTDLDLNPTSEQ